jgi:hypothetical protein
VDIVEFLCTGMAPPEMTIAHKKKLVVKEANYKLIVGNLYKLGEDEILRHCVLDHKISMILKEVHDEIARGNYVGK